MSDIDTPADDQPIWKRDFPYEVVAEEEVTRREFTRYLVLGAGTMAAANVGLAMWTQLRSINIGKPRAIVALAEVAIGDSYLFRYPSERDPAVLLRLGESEVVSFSQKCTHLGCVVFYQTDEQRWHCPCHNVNFDTRTGESFPDLPLVLLDASTWKSAMTDRFGH